MRLMLIIVATAVAMLLDPRVSQATQMPWCAGTNTGRSFHYNCSLLGNVRAGSDRWQPRILQSEPVLPRARSRSAQGQAEAILLLIQASSALGVGGLRGNRERVPSDRIAVLFCGAL
jgi:hypothetical protein